MFCMLIKGFPKNCNCVEKFGIFKLYLFRMFLSYDMSFLDVFHMLLICFSYVACLVVLRQSSWSQIYCQYSSLKCYFEVSATEKVSFFTSQIVTCSDIYSLQELSFKKLTRRRAINRKLIFPCQLLIADKFCHTRLTRSCEIESTCWLHSYLERFFQSGQQFCFL